MAAWYIDIGPGSLSQQTDRRCLLNPPNPFLLDNDPALLESLTLGHDRMNRVRAREAQ